MKEVHRGRATVRTSSFGRYGSVDEISGDPPAADRQCCCYDGMSSEEYTSVLDGSSNLVVIRNSLWRLQAMDQACERAPGHRVAGGVALIAGREGTHGTRTYGRPHRHGGGRPGRRGRPVPAERTEYRIGSHGGIVAHEVPPRSFAAP